MTEQTPGKPRRHHLPVGRKEINESLNRLRQPDSPIDIDGMTEMGSIESLITIYRNPDGTRTLALLQTDYEFYEQSFKEPYHQEFPVSALEDIVSFSLEAGRAQTLGEYIAANVPLLSKHLLFLSPPESEVKKADQLTEEELKLTTIAHLTELANIKQEAKMHLAGHNYESRYTMGEIVKEIESDSPFGKKFTNANREYLSLLERQIEEGRISFYSEHPNT